MSNVRSIIISGSYSARIYAEQMKKEFPDYKIDIYNDYDVRSSDIFQNLHSGSFLKDNITDIISNIYLYDNLILIDPRSTFAKQTLPLIFHRLRKTRISIETEFFPSGEGITTNTPLVDHVIPFQDSGIYVPDVKKKKNKQNVVGLSASFDANLFSASYASRFRRAAIAVAHHFRDHQFLWRPEESEFISQDDGCFYSHVEIARDNIIIMNINQVSLPLDNFLEEIDILITIPSTLAVIARDAGFPLLVFAEDDVEPSVGNLFSDSIVKNVDEMQQSLQSFYDGERTSVDVKPWREFNKKYFRGILEKVNPADAIMREDQVLIALEINSWTDSHEIV